MGGMKNNGGLGNLFNVDVDGYIPSNIPYQCSNLDSLSYVLDFSLILFQDSEKN